MANHKKTGFLRYLLSVAILLQGRICYAQESESERTLRMSPIIPLRSLVAATAVPFVAVMFVLRWLKSIVIHHFSGC